MAAFGLNENGDGEPVGLWFEPERVRHDEHVYVDLTPDELDTLQQQLGGLPLSLGMRLASLVVHAGELNVDGDANAARTDIAAIKGLVEDTEVVAWLATFDPVLLPTRRDAGLVADDAFTDSTPSKTGT